MRVLVLSSGGKDSAYSTWWALQRGWEVVGLVTIQVEGDDSMMFQIPSTAIVALQAASAGIPWLPVTVSGLEEVEMNELERALEGVVAGSSKRRDPLWTESERENVDWPDNWQWPADLQLMRPGEPIDALVAGALRSDYQKTRIERMCERLGIISYTPLWHNDASSHMRDLINHGFEVMITSVTTDGMGEKWVGRTLDHGWIDALESASIEYRFNVDGEGGEYETTVLNSPWFKRRIKVNHTPHWTGRRGWADIWAAELETPE